MDAAGFGPAEKLQAGLFSVLDALTFDHLTGRAHGLPVGDRHDNQKSELIHAFSLCSVAPVTSVNAFDERFGIWHAFKVALHHQHNAHLAANVLPCLRVLVQVREHRGKRVSRVSAFAVFERPCLAPS